MMCEDCQKRPACVHITKVNNNRKAEKHLCEHCAQQAGEFSFSFDTGLSVQDLLKGMFSQGYMDVQQKNFATCLSCGMSYNDFSQNGKIGCSACYSTFAEKLEKMLRRIHGANVHTGKIPLRAGGDLAARLKIKKMRRQLEAYIIGEEYEQAAKLRDEIREIEKLLENQEKGEERCR